MTRTYAESFQLLSTQLELIGDPRPDVASPPRHDDPAPGPTIFRYIVDDADLSSITLPGLYVGRSSLTNVSFAGGDLRLSTSNWSNFMTCDFSGCNLAGADLRACVFQGCSFGNADLRGVDLRHSTFQACSFTGARLQDAKVVRIGWLARARRRRPAFSAEQEAQLTWSEPGPEPHGG